MKGKGLKVALVCLAVAGFATGFAACGGVELSCENGEHFYGDWSKGTLEHTKTCSICQKEISGEHVFENYECTVCGALYGTQDLKYLLSLDGVSYTLTGLNGKFDKEKNIVIPPYYNGLPVTRIDYDALSGKGASITIPATVTDIDIRAFINTRVEEIIVDEANPVYKSVNGDLYSKDGKQFIHYATEKKDEEKKNVKSFALPEGVEVIKRNAFNGYCRNIESLVIPASVRTIEEKAFAVGVAGITLENTVGWQVGALDEEGVFELKNGVDSELLKNPEYAAACLLGHYKEYEWRKQ